MIFKTEKESVENFLLNANSFIETIFNKNAPLVLLGVDYQAFTDSNIITVGAFAPTDEQLYRMYLKEIHNFYDKELEYEFIMFLHEIGHIVTNNEFTDDEMEDYEKCVADIESREDVTNHLLEYYDLDVEWRATEWAVNYIKNTNDFFLKVAQHEYIKRLRNLRRNITCEN